MRVLSPKVVLWRNVLTSKQTASCRALSKVITVSFPLFSSLLFPLFSSLLFVKKQFPPFLCCCWLLLNPDSRAQRENQDLLFYWIFCHHEPSLSFLRRTKHDQKQLKSSSAPSFHRFVIYKRTQYTHLQNGPFDAIRFSWQANYRKQGFLQTVRAFDLRVMELRVELRLSFFFVLYSTLFFFGRD